MAETSAPPGSAVRLPAEVNAFVGRRDERRAIRQQLAYSRLITLTGFGGIGKTRLALRVATEVRRAFADGVRFVPLGQVTDAKSLPNTVATMLGIQDRSTRSASESLVDYLGNREMLLILDNCEHVVEACAMLTGTLLGTCPKLRILATSRESLRVTGEIVHRVPPLPIPPLGIDPVTPLHQYDAVTLFVDRARAAVPEFALSDENRDAVASISRTLEGIPLALELAAVRLHALSPDEIAQQLSDRWELLSQGSRNAPDRQRTIAACIEWSFDLCSEAERNLWACTSVFSGGFERDAITHVCGELLDATESVPDLMLGLVDKSILVAVDQGRLMRYRMLSPIRHRGLRRLRELGQLAEVRRRHRDWCVDLSSRAAQEWVSDKQTEWVSRLRREQDNIRSALEFSVSEPNEAEPGLRMGNSLLEFGIVEGLFRTGRMWIGRLLDRSPEPTVTRALALRTSALWATMQGDLDAAKRLLDEGQELASLLGEDVEVQLRMVLGHFALNSGDVDQAIAVFEDVVVQLRRLDDASKTAYALIFLALAHLLAGNLDRAMECHRECMGITEPAGESWYRSYSLWIAGLTTWMTGDAEAAKALVKESLKLKRALGEQLGIGMTFEALAWIASKDDPERSVMLLGAAQNQWDAIGTSTGPMPGLAALHAHCLQVVRGGLDENGFDAAWSIGNVFSQSSAIEYALEEHSPQKPKVASPTSTAPGSVLTKREQEIAEMAAQGLTNKDIASALVISKRTAETHVGHILAKLGFTSRHQITAWVSEQHESVGR